MIYLKIENRKYKTDILFFFNFLFLINKIKYILLIFLLTKDLLKILFNFFYIYFLLF